ncbi:hypothetical protein AOQ84DRAFT_147014 [Glonium stellatum]|uniref:Uncharacterized protein n=1 Tax=Glonium stellatum TaxID=574774 RepID=A0A8E2JNC5_9PEZI|nr:hypothetical protein AOQ84DRAFT_147014 [Glonium stellatum]
MDRGIANEKGLISSWSSFSCAPGEPFYSQQGLCSPNAPGMTAEGYDKTLLLRPLYICMASLLCGPLGMHQKLSAYRPCPRPKKSDPEMNAPKAERCSATIYTQVDYFCFDGLGPGPEFQATASAAHLLAKCLTAGAVDSTNACPIHP